MNLGKLPPIDTPRLEAEWLKALAIITELGELSVPCAMDIDTRRILFQTIKAMGAKSALDIGTYVGTSALTFALAGCEVVTVDIKDANGCEGHWVHAGRQTPHAMTRCAGVADQIDFVTQDSVEYLKSTDRQFDFICIDGWHEWHQVYAEIPLAISRLNAGGLIFLDDVHHPGYEPQPGMDFIPGPWVALQRHMLQGAAFRVSYFDSGAFLTC